MTAKISLIWLVGIGVLVGWGMGVSRTNSHRGLTKLPWGRGGNG